MRSEITLNQYARDRMVGSRLTAIPLWEDAELVLAHGYEVVFDFCGVEVTQSFIDELVGGLILRRGLDVLEPIVFRAPLKMHFFRDGCVSSVLESSCMTYTLRFSARRFLALTKKLLFLEVPFRACSDDVRAIIEFVATDRCDQYLKTHTH